MTCISLLVGTTIWLILGSIITTLLIHLNAAHSEYTARMTELNQYMKHRELPQVGWAIHMPYVAAAAVRLGVWQDLPHLMLQLCNPPGCP